MKRILLTKLELYGSGKKTAVLDFQPGLNVITGDSDTGKTFAFQCLNYILGADKIPKQITEAQGYSAISLDFTIDNEQYRLERSIGAKKIDVIHNGETKCLSTKHDATNMKNLSRYLLSLLLENEDTITIKQTQKNKKRTLSFRDIVHICTIDETDIIAETSSFQSIQHTEKTPRKAVLKYLITGTDDSTIAEEDDSENENMRRAGVVEFLTKKKTILTEKIDQIETDEKFKLFSGNSDIPIMMERIKTLRKSIADSNQTIDANLEKIRRLKQECLRDEVRVEEFKKLRLHYLEETKKNGMIQTHADYLAQLPHLGCPLCNQLLNPHLLAHDLEDDLFEYFKEKHVDLQQKAKDLDLAIQDILERIDSNCSTIKRLENENASISASIASTQHILDTLAQSITLIRHFDSMNKSLEIYRQELIVVEQDIVAYSEKVKKEPPTPEICDLQQYDAYCKSVENTLKSWGFSADVAVSFETDLLDLSIDKKSRSSWGKGYRAFIMSAMVVGLMRYCCEHNRLHPGFVIIDSPLVSLKERKKDAEGDWVEDYMERKMIEDLINCPPGQQVIIFENKDLKYDFDYNYIEFRHQGDKRHGFIS